MNNPELGAVYCLPSGKFAFLASVALDGCWVMDVVDVHQAQAVPDGMVTFSPAMAGRLSLAWHAPQWASKVRDRVALQTRVHRQQVQEAAEATARRAAWKVAQARNAQAAAAHDGDATAEASA